MNDEHNIPDHGFKAPKDYFDSLDARLFESIASEEIPKNTGFSMPNRYFETLDERIMESVLHKEDVGKVRPLFNRRFVVAVAGIAASLLLFFSLLQQSSLMSEGVEYIETTMLTQYIEEDVDIDLYDVVAILENEDGPEVTFENSLFTKAAMEEYLLENVEETTLIQE
ncbi:hypothetical protein [Altibacter sp.]|uniref:hypothetical protein n=1 Tax=Altibacter sp. TaxID=2024823 RepID=UPI000C8DFAE7|nr:hypothetical protein [Altibacter sp.]MAP54975.1 hypothetical protein [Altibacter sp.]